MRAYSYAINHYHVCMTYHPQSKNQFAPVVWRLIHKADLCSQKMENDAVRLVLRTSYYEKVMEIEYAAPPAGH